MRWTRIWNTVVSRSSVRAGIHGKRHSVPFPVAAANTVALAISAVLTCGFCPPSRRHDSVWFRAPPYGDLLDAMRSHVIAASSCSE